MLCSMKELLAKAEEGNYAVGSFTVPDMECLMGTLRAAEETETPIIIQIAEGRLKHSPLHLLGSMMVRGAKESPVKVAVHFDHGLTEEKITEAMDLGFTSVMFDGSRYSFEENIAKTNEISRIARGRNVSLEAELGSIGGKEATDKAEEVRYTGLEEAITFASSTDIDAFAIAIGNAHGHYKGKPQLNFERLQEIHEAVSIPLVLHGGSGISDEEFRRCIDNGIRKINIATASMDAMVEYSRNYLLTDKPHNYYELNESMTEGVYQNVKHLIKVFNNREPLV